MAPRTLARLKSVDFYRKLPTDLTEATLSGAAISIATTFIILFLLGAELSSYMSTQTRTDMVVDRSAHGELLRVNFNISFPQLSCEFATLDVSDAMGLKRLNLTKTVRKQPITEEMQRAGQAVEDKKHHDPKYDEEHPGFQYEDVNISVPLTNDMFDQTAAQYDILVVNFFAPWCPWCQRLGPTWEATTEEIHNRYPESDGRIRLAKVDCTAEVDLCRKHYITAFPSIRIFRHGSGGGVRAAPRGPRRRRVPQLLHGSQRPDSHVVLTTIEPRRRPELQFDAYEYTVQSHKYNAEDHASAKFTYKMSPIQIVVTEQPKQLYKFLTAICAVIGGVFTVAGILDGMVHQVNKIAKKVDLGKQG
ncbi:hypothetical protein CHLNCDRAFT_138016 [Chlorella variabilis]|uniref:Thioredoxin domain-containing protein n=1 Tax=Chlorella variabilis TaxID=554065 RepID=E1Z525_CHLVA|nr:hypothetical protein CHLNCDRAFT_138016 [Chlorella variabilis]EFN59158.1 hypothetical protein CHLNCDRAFT_138016 [Chlorella variabilis]|eukprot:XP_005851260.1 hypothetical protein CHLNCDRAFT_138016 [Chlorella variabilis]